MNEGDSKNYMTNIKKKSKAKVAEFKGYNNKMIGEEAECDTMNCTNVGEPSVKLQKIASFAKHLPDSSKFIRNLTDKQKNKRTEMLIDGLKEWVDKENKKSW